MRRLLLVLCAIPSLSQANVITFDVITGNPSLLSLTEDGIAATGRLGSYGSPGAVHIDRAGTGYGNKIELTTGSVFVADNALIRADGSGYCAATNCSGSAWADPIDYIWFSGFLDNNLVSSFGIYRPAASAFETFDLSSLGPIDLLRIEARTYLDLGLPGHCTDGSGCGHFDLDSVSLTPTSAPEPATLSLLSAGLLGLLASRRRRK